MAMNFTHRAPKQNKRDLRIVGAISIDLNGVLDEDLDKIDDKTRAQVGIAILKEFCSNSTVHGVRYFTERKRHWIERIWWIIAFILSTVLCFYAIRNLYFKWERRPVIVSFDDKTTPVATIPFPAVTICTTKKFTKDYVDTDLFQNILIEMETNATAYKNYKPEIIHRLDAVQQVCSKEMNNLVDDLIIPRTESIHKTIADISPEYDSFILFPTFMGQLIHLRPIFTGEGLCYTFNSLNSWEIYKDDVAVELMTVDNSGRTSSHWNMENGYNANVSENEIYPFRVFGCGRADTLTILMGITIDDSQLYCSGFAPGFRLLLHLPDELPRLPDDFVFIPIEQEIYISVRPNVIATSRGLRRYPPTKRGCFFKSERQLRFFQTYGQRNCEFECAANFTKKTCDCVQFYMPRTKETRVCTIVDNKCYINAADEYSKKLLVKKCNCLPDCTSISYDVEISQAQKHYSVNDIALKDALNQSSEEANSNLFITFKEHHFISINRTEAYTFFDFVANCGGLLGLFMGISLLSVIELIYYFTLRLCCKLRQKEPLQTKVSIYNKRSNLAVMKKQLERRRF